MIYLICSYPGATIPNTSMKINKTDIINAISSLSNFYSLPNEMFNQFYFNWINAIISTYTSIENKTITYIGEYLGEDINFAGQNIRLHFYVPRAIKIAKSLNIYPELLSLLDFKTTSYGLSKYIKYTPIYNNVSNFNYADCDVPIVTVPFYIQNSQMLVIDGNHRVTAKIAANSKSILSLNLPFDKVRNLLLLTNFEKSIYSFLYEINNIYQYINNSYALEILSLYNQ